MGGRSWQSYSREDKLECCERLTYAQPVDLLVERLDPDFATTFEKEWTKSINRHGSEPEEEEVALGNGSTDDDGDGEDKESPVSRSLKARNKSAGGQRAMDIKLVMNP